MIWATVSSWSCFFWLNRVSPSLYSLAAKNIINLISVFATWWCPCVKTSLLLLEEGVCYDQCILLEKLYEPFLCFIVYSNAKYVCYSRCFLTTYFAFQSPIMKKSSFLGVCSKRSCRSVGSCWDVPGPWQVHGMRAEPARQLLLTRGCPGGPVRPLWSRRDEEGSCKAALPLEAVPGARYVPFSFCLTVVGLSTKFWK